MNTSSNRIHQIWYEDPASLGAKYEMASRLGLRGVGFYCASASWPDRVMGTDAEDAAMWNSVREHFVKMKSDDSPRSSAAAVSWLPPRCTLTWSAAESDAEGVLSDGQLNHAVWYADASEKVFLADLPPPERCPADAGDRRTISIALARGERQPFQIVITPSTPITARIRALINTDSGVQEAPVSRVGYTNVTTASNPQATTGLFPDPLPPTDGLVSGLLAPGRSHAFWVTVHSTLDGAKLSTSGHELVVEMYHDSGLTTQSFPLNIRLWSFALPSVAESSLTTGSAWGSGFGRDELFPPMTDEQRLEMWYENMAQHRVNSYAWMGQLPQIGGSLSKDRKSFRLNSSDYDAQVSKLRAKGVRRLRLPTLLGSTRWLHSHYLFSDQTWTFGAKDAAVTLPVFASNMTETVVLEPEFVRVFKLVYGTITAHVSSTGLLNETYAAFIDEPDMALNASDFPGGKLCIEKECWSTDVINRFTTAAVVALAELHRSLHPGLKLLSTAGDAASISALGPLVHLWIVDIDVWTAPGVGSLLSHLRRTASAEVLVYSKRAFFRIPMRILANPASRQTMRSRSSTWPVCGRGPTLGRSGEPTTCRRLATQGFRVACPGTPMQDGQHSIRG